MPTPVSQKVEEEEIEDDEVVEDRREAHEDPSEDQVQHRREDHEVAEGEHPMDLKTQTKPRLKTLVIRDT